MARVVVAAAVVLALAAAVLLLRLGLSAARPYGTREILEAQMEREGLQRIAFVLLVALILYVAVTGGRI